MGWFTGKPSSPPMNEDEGTIDGRTWRDLQARAAKANPERVRPGSEEFAKGARRGAEQYRKRTQS